MKKPKSMVYMYILARTDLASMNAGKAVAQGAHAANKLVKMAKQSGDKKLRKLLREWEKQTDQGFGVTITLGVKEAQMRSAVQVAQALGLHADICHDPTYPLLDGEVCHLIPLDTGAFIFGRKADCAPVVGNFRLMD